MSGDGTYVQSHGGGKYAPPPTSYPPLTHNPHDPSHYYKGVDGRYYYTPDGNPHPEYGQPPVAKTITPSEMPVQKPDINDKWGHEASKGYHMKPEDLRNLATALEGDMGELQSIVGNNQADMTAAGAVGQDDWQAGHDFTKLASKAQTDFAYFYNLLISTYNDVISRLRATANNGQQGEDDTHSAVKAQQAGYTGNTGNPNAHGNNQSW
jgi:hypothetical protein